MKYRTTDWKDNDSKNELIRNFQNTKNMLKVFKACKAMQLKSGKTEDSPEILYINIKINEFENDIRILRQKLSIPDYYVVF